MSVERTPDELAEAQAKDQRVMAVVDEAVHNAASWMVAEVLNEDADVCERWVNAIWNGLRNQLDGEDRLVAIVRLLEERAFAEAQSILCGIGEVQS